MSAAELKAKTFEWFDERLGLRMARDLLDHKVVPLHPGTAWYYFGGITLFLFGVQMFTGLLLLLYYRPTRRRGLRQRALHHDARGVRLAHPLDP